MKSSRRNASGARPQEETASQFNRADGCEAEMNEAAEKQQTERLGRTPASCC
ncbi:MAG: hypothetical protein IK990_03330 [Ruminiclostridium sp.]|nr:hypothetical protein [Ruminiclostridium sp.]